MVAPLTDDAWPTHATRGVGVSGTPSRSARSCVTARSGAACRCGWCQQAQTASPRSVATSPSQTDTARPRGLFVLTLDSDWISAITWFADNQRLPQFGLPQTLR